MKRSRRPIQQTLLLSLLVFAGFSASAATFDRVIAFGDSLADSGNVFILSGALQHKPYPPIPGAPYPIGGTNFSNGATWVEQLAASLGSQPSGEPSLRAPGVFTNYAFGGARARKFGEAPSLSDQVALYLGDFGAHAPANALYVVSIGGNDLRDAAVDPEKGPAIIADAVQAIAVNLNVLMSHGARHFIIANQPNLSVVPAIVLQEDPALAAAALLASLGFNLALEEVLTVLDDDPNVQITRLDAFTLSSTIATSPDSLGFDDGTTPCLTFGVQGDAICENQDGHFYWDAIHPTRAGHALIADQAVEELMSQ